MTRDEARRRAVEAMRETAMRNHIAPLSEGDALDLINTAERAMADAGWRWARDCGEMEVKTIPTLLAKSPEVSRAEGWNACRAAMLAPDDAGG